MVYIYAYTVCRFAPIRSIALISCFAEYGFQSTRPVFSGRYLLTPLQAAQDYLSSIMPFHEVSLVP
jgi:hypothetical protein